jgi:hypothetical protein
VLFWGGFDTAHAPRDQVTPLVARLRALDEGKGREEKLFARINSMDDLLPADQPAKLELLRQIRALMTDDALAELPPDERDELRELKPPADLRPLVDADVPEALAWPFIENDGSRGRLVLAMSGWGYDFWNAHDLVRFDHDVRALGLPPGTRLGGSAFVFADMLREIEIGGVQATLVALVGAMLVVLVMMRLTRHALVTLLCGAVGIAFMLALSSAAGLRVNFLDFVALPITIGIGIDYAVNISARHRQDGRRGVATVAGAVVVCSYTTIVGYGSLLFSSNLAIRSFGHAAILGEATCIVAAIVLAPALLALWPRPDET